mmetsp:Transcript_24903/g.65372  ORF Transcript_24903/g.65372 Transcript_24903/m.65372 type:complete len:101 (-) Transcript_24903:2141-2443(-)
MEEFGRDIVQSACLLQAEQHAQEPLKKNGEFDLMEKSLKIHIPRSCKDGSDVFNEYIAPASKLLISFHDGSIKAESNGKRRRTEFFFSSCRNHDSNRERN